MELYFLFVVFVFIVLVFDNWLDGADLYKGTAFVMFLFAIIPFINVIILFVATIRILDKLIPSVLLKGKK